MKSTEIIKITLSILIFLGLASCANKDKKLEEGELASSEEFLEEGLENEGDLLVEDKGDGESEVADLELDSSEEMENIASLTGEVGVYVAEKGETLMQIAFKIYGDYRQWKQLMSWNNLSSQSVLSGTKLKYEKPANKFHWSPRGNPYLVKKGDTLGFISQEKYNTSRRWREIYDNNKPLIRDPNLIFAGFTIYYIPDVRDTASE